MICPCKNCERQGCGEYHAQCKAYLEYAEYRKQINEKEREERRFMTKSNAIRRSKWNKKI